MLAKNWKRIGLIILIVACFANITSKLVRSVSFNDNVKSTVTNVINTVDGTASFGKLQQKIKYDDNTMLEFCKQNNLEKFINVTTTEKLNKKEFNNYLSVIDGKVVTDDGEILENTFIEEIQNFNVKTK